MPHLKPGAPISDALLLLAPNAQAPSCVVMETAKGQRGKNGSAGVTPHRGAPSKQPPARPRRVTWAPSPAKGRSAHPREHPRKPPPPKDAPVPPKRHPSTVDALEKPISSTTSSSSSSDSSDSSPTSGTPQGDIHREVPEGGAEGAVLGREELAAIGDWMAETRQELRRMREGDYIGSYKPPSLSSVLKDLAAGTLDEDKFLISRRVQRYFREAVRRAGEKRGKEEEEAPPSSSSRTRPPHPDPIPSSAPLTPTATDSAFSTTTTSF
ncbi:hypothetical protein O3P69_008870 [Scylla paramamosain]|uniref:Uncharacterized protein n=1 Tax=Scylla paramamosain TaxID=85552 RepID=A0AAW0TPP2_SCYPA